ncbi:MAG: tRNA pseudouridine13 synthase [Lentisphaeria bacterium]|jgi:tRNA pseudouridine13 synthase
MSFSLDFTFAFEKPSCNAKFRCSPEDFRVDESLGFEPSGEGEHVYVHIKKRGENTDWVAEKLAKFFKVKSMDVSYSGMKDRHAITRQWFSIYLPGKDQPIDWPAFVAGAESDIEILGSKRHHQKLRRGMHSANQFEIVLRELNHSEGLDQRLQKIKQSGVPNYFGEQRFGRGMGNLKLAQEWMEQGRPIRNRNKRGLAMSAARSYLFNLVLSRRVELGTWAEKIAGDHCDETLGLATGPLWGRGRSAAQEEALELEQEVLAPHEQWCNQLEHCGLSQDRRALALLPIDFQWQLEGDVLVLKFGLPPGQFATSVLREMAVLEQQFGG